MNSANIKILEGNQKILVSAPHVYPHNRPSLNSSLKQGEEFTDKIVEGICESVGCYGIYITSPFFDYDPNFNDISANPYKNLVKEIVEKNNIEYFIDLHGLSDKHDFDIGLYTCMRYSKSKRFADEIILEINNQKELRGVSYAFRYMADNGQETLAQYTCSELRIPSVQIEIASYIRKDSTLRNALIKGISSVLLKT